jgi:hypothetical protein
VRGHIERFHDALIAQVCSSSKAAFRPGLVVKEAL